MRIVRKVVIGLAFFIALVFSAAYFLSPQFRIERSIVIKVQPESVFDQINAFHNWHDWSPYAVLDPQMKVTYTGPDSGIGAAYAWAGNKAVGEGQMTIMTSIPSKRVDIKLEFVKPLKTINVVEFTFKPGPNSDAKNPETIVTWAMSGPRPILMRVISLFINMDRIVGDDFERGLKSLKWKLESRANSDRDRT